MTLGFLTAHLPRRNLTGIAAGAAPSGPLLVARHRAGGGPMKNPHQPGSAHGARPLR